MAEPSGRHLRPLRRLQGHLGPAAPGAAAAGEGRPPQLAVTKLAGALGAEIEGLDASLPCDAATAGQLRAALREHLVVVLRRQSVTPAQFETFCSSCLGGLYVHPIFPGIEGHPAVLAVSNRGKKLDRTLHLQSAAAACKV